MLTIHDTELADSIRRAAEEKGVSVEDLLRDAIVPKNGTGESSDAKLPDFDQVTGKVREMTEEEVQEYLREQDQWIASIGVDLELKEPLSTEEINRLLREEYPEHLYQRYLEMGGRPFDPHVD